MMMKLQQALDWIQARQPSARLVGEGSTPVQRVHTDSRSLQAGDLFVALQGERFDAHDFLPQARQAGACAGVARGGLQAAGLPGIEVPDTLAALGALAAGWRSQFTLPLIAVTGSNGKTTVTQMLASILRAQAGEGAFATQGNLNNAIGVPQTLLRLRAAHRMGVVELGMNHPGEIAGLADMARPTVALVNNAQREHLEFMHTVQAVAEENGAVLAALPPDGVAVFPGDDAFTPLWRALAGTRRCLCFGAAPAAQAEPTQAPAVQVWCEEAQWQGDAWALRIATPGGHFATRLQVAGRHNVRNALAATACALAAVALWPQWPKAWRHLRPWPGARVCWRCPCRGAPSRWWTIATTPTPTPCKPPSPCWLNCPRRAGWCWVTWARSAARGRNSTPRRVRWRAPAALSTCWRWARSAPMRCRPLPTPAGQHPLPRRGILTTKPPCWRRCAQPCPAWAVCW